MLTAGDEGGVEGSREVWESQEVGDSFVSGMNVEDSVTW